MEINNLPEEIKKNIKNKKIELVSDDHRSDDIVYNISSIDENNNNLELILKISKNKELLLHEKNADEYLSKKINACKCINYCEDSTNSYYLKTKLKGENLISEKYLNNPELLINLIKEAFDILHNIDCSDCKLKNSESEGNKLVHGDFCLPNIIINKENHVEGFIDTGLLGLGDPLIDYEWCIWSFEYNLKTNKYTKLLIDKLGIEFNLNAKRKYVNNDD